MQIVSGAAPPPDDNDEERDLYRAAADWVAVLHCCKGDKGGARKIAVMATRTPTQSERLLQIAEGNTARALVGQPEACTSLRRFTGEVLCTGTVPVLPPPSFKDFRTAPAVKLLPRASQASERKTDVLCARAHARK